MNKLLIMDLAHWAAKLLLFYHMAKLFSSFFNFLLHFRPLHLINI